MLAGLGSRRSSSGWHKNHRGLGSDMWTPIVLGVDHQRFNTWRITSIRTNSLILIPHGHWNTIISSSGVIHGTGWELRYHRRSPCGLSRFRRWFVMVTRIVPRKCNDPDVCNPTKGTDMHGIPKLPSIPAPNGAFRWKSICQCTRPNTTLERDDSQTEPVRTNGRTAIRTNLLVAPRKEQGRVTRTAL